MKKANRMTLLATVFAVCLPLAACGAMPGHGDWVPAKYSYGAFSEDGYYYTTNYGILYYLDLANGGNACLCTKPGCSHDSEECDAFLSASGDGCPMFFWDGGLYYVNEEASGVQLYRRNADGSGAEHVMQLCRSYTEDKKAIMVDNYQVADGIFYYCATISAVVKDDAGALREKQEATVINRADLRAKREETVAKGTDTTLYLGAVRADAALFSEMDLPEGYDSPVSDPSLPERYNRCPSRLRQWDQQDNQIKTLLEKTKAELEQIDDVVENQVYYRYFDDKSGGAFRVEMSFDLQTGETRRVYHDQNSLLKTIINDEYALCWNEISGDDGYYDILELQTQKHLPIELEADSLSLRNQSSAGVILRRGTSVSSEAMSFTYFVVPLEGLKDGIQQDEAVDFYVEQWG